MDLAQKFDYALLIGRFQPFHKGHLELFKHASKIASKVIVLIGSHNSAKSIRNPWTSEERERFIQLSLKEFSPDQYIIANISDSAYNFQDWIVRVQRCVYSITGENKNIALVGHFKDETSYYLDYFPSWKLITLPAQADGICSTLIRNACFTNNIESIQNKVDQNVYNALGLWLLTDDCKNLVKEFKYVNNFRDQYKTSEVPVSFVSADAIIVHKSSILLIKNRDLPGKNLFRLPGGLIQRSETIEKSCLQLVKDQTKIDLTKIAFSAFKIKHIFDHPSRDPRGRVICHAFLYDLKSIEIEMSDFQNGDIEVNWVPLYKLPNFENRFYLDYFQIVNFFINRMN